MTNLLDLMVKVGIDDQASGKIGGLSGNIKTNLSNAAKVGAAAVLGLTAAVGGATTALVSQVNQVADYGDNVDKMSQKMGMSAEAYQEWDAVMKHSGTSMETMKAGMKTLANAVESGNEAFQRIGLTQEQLASMSQEDLFSATIAGLQGVENETERTYLAGQLLGRGATELGALLNESAEDTQAMKKRVHELGGVMSGEAVKNAARFKDSLQDLQTAVSGLKRGLMSEFLPAITDVMDGLQELFIGNTDEGLAKVKQGIDGVLGKMQEVLPGALEVGAGIIGSIAEGIVQNIPNVLTVLSDMLMQFVNGVVNNRQSLVNGATQWLQGMADALADFVPSLLAAVIVLLGVAMEAVGQAAGQMLAAASLWLMGVFDAIGEAVGEIGGKIGELIQSGVDAVGEFFGQMYDAGANLVQGLIDGIAGNVVRVADTILGGLRGAVNQVKSFLGIESPSKLFRGFGRYTMEGMALGIADRAGKVVDAMTQAAQDAAGAAQFDMTARYGFAAGIGAQNAAQARSGQTIVYIGDVQAMPDTAIYGAAVNLFTAVYDEGRA